MMAVHAYTNLAYLGKTYLTSLGKNWITMETHRLFFGVMKTGSKRRIVLSMELE